MLGRRRKKSRNRNRYVSYVSCKIQWQYSAEMCEYKYLRKCPNIEVDTITHNTHFPHSLAKMFMLSLRSCLENIVHNSRIPKEVSLCKYVLCIPNHLEEVSLLQHDTV